MKLNLGCGCRYLDGYINADFSNIGSNGETINVDHVFNFLEGIPYSDNAFEEIQFTDVLEHFNRHNGLNVLKEIFRVLAPEGKLILTVPPALQQMKKLIYVMENITNITMDDFFKAHENVKYWKWQDDVAGATHESNGMDGDSHKTFYCIKALKSLLTYCGFKILFEDENIIKVIATK